MWRTLSIGERRVRYSRTATDDRTRHTHSDTHTKLIVNWKLVNVILSRNSCRIEIWGKRRIVHYLVVLNRVLCFPTFS